MLIINRAHFYNKKSLIASVLKWWYVVLIVGLTYLFTHQALMKKERLYSSLEVQKSELQLTRQKLLEEREDLKLQIQSQSDPEWVELALMRRLGVVPEGQIKVHFIK